MCTCHSFRTPDADAVLPNADMAFVPLTGAQDVNMEAPTMQLDSIDDALSWSDCSQYFSLFSRHKHCMRDVQLRRGWMLYHISRFSVVKKNLISPSFTHWISARNLHDSVCGFPIFVVKRSIRSPHRSVTQIQIYEDFHNHPYYCAYHIDYQHLPSSSYLVDTIAKTR